jgi:hypothetical protein
MPNPDAPDVGFVWAEVIRLAEEIRELRRAIHGLGQYLGYLASKNGWTPPFCIELDYDLARDEEATPYDRS